MYKELCLSLHGEWRFQLDPEKMGVSEKFYLRELEDNIPLPGSTDEAQKGDGYTEVEIERLTRKYPYTGYAWYQKEVFLESEWVGKHIDLFLERTRISRVWVNDIEIGSRDSLSTPHKYDLSEVLTEGKHKITILIDNSEYPIPGGHLTSGDTQTNWNGILGKIELRGSDLVWIDGIKTYSDVENSVVRLKFLVKNKAAVNGQASISVKVCKLDEEITNKEKQCENIIISEKEYSVNVNEFENNFEINHFIGETGELWDEYSPSLYKLFVQLYVNNENVEYTDKKEILLGLRQFASVDARFEINGRKVFLRGKHDALVFPLTGYAPMEVDEWIKVLRIAKSYGINHYRFHTCCPPEACFVAADLEGIYLQPELPFWGPLYDENDEEYDAVKADYLHKESLRILDEYGNHPSFVMFSLGNELHGSRKALSEFLMKLKNHDNRHLYAEGSNNFFWDPKLLDEADFWSTMRTGQGDAMVRGSFSHADKPLGHVQGGSPNTLNDFSESIKGVPVPVVGHEIGQYQCFPDFNEIDKYTGVLKACNLEIFKKRLEDANMLDKADMFFKASGKLAVLCYREEIESALRTEGFGGFQILDLQDFPGQGTALVGILDAFMDSKGLIAPEKWREFCSDMVLLASFDRYTYFGGDSFKAEIKVANHSFSALENACIEWTLSTSGTGSVDGNIVEEGIVVESGSFKKEIIGQGSVTSLGVIEIQLPELIKAEKLELSLRLKNSAVVNHYNIWVYPKHTSSPYGEGVFVCKDINEAMGLLEKGNKVILIPQSSQISKNSIEGFYCSDFWCYPMFRKICESNGKEVAPGTLGILCDSNHGALSAFPTDYHSDWQWWSIVENSRPIILDKTPKDFSPIIQVIDNFERNHKLGLLFEGRYKGGKVLVCSSDLLKNQHMPEVAQFLRSISQYVASADFDPEWELEFDAIFP